MIINTTTVYCSICKCSHPTTIEKENKKVIAKISCPASGKVEELSSDADMFMEIRKKSHIDLSEKTDKVCHNFVNFIDITNTCNFECPICGVKSLSMENPIFLSVDEIYKRAKELRKQGGKSITLSGGEPTLHPQLINIIKKLKPLKLRIYMATNGFRLGKEPNLAKELKKSGLSKVMLQFDTFDQETHQKMRGNNFTDIKLQAVKNIVNARLRLGIIATVTSLNIKELGRILEFGLSLAPNLSTIIFQGATPTGRYLLPRNSVVDREQIIKAVIESKVIPGLKLDHIWPLPVFRPWGMQLHPDCGVNTILIVNNKKIRPLSEFIDINKLYTRMAQNHMKSSWITKNLVPLYYILCSIKKGRHMDLLASVKGYLSGRGNRSIVLFGLGSYLMSRFQDEQKLARCASSQLTHSGPVCPCIYDIRDENYAISRKKDELCKKL